MYTFAPNPSIQKAAATEALYAGAYHALGEGRASDAQKQFAMMVGAAPFDVRAWVGLGASLEQVGKYQRALGVYLMGTKLVPASVYCKLGQARSLFKLGKRHEAWRVLDQAELLCNSVEEVRLIDQMRGEL